LGAGEQGIEGGGFRAIVAFIPLAEWRKLFLAVVEVEFAIAGIAQAGARVILETLTDCRASFAGIRASSDMARASLLVVRDARKCS
jgi:hypothetical protein